MSQETTASPSSAAQQPNTSTPSLAAMREHRAQQQANLILDQFAERFTQRDFIPFGGDSVLFAMLTQLPDWSADTELAIVDEHGDEIACYLKGSDAAVIQHAVTLVQHADGTYTGLGNTNTYVIEPLFHGVFRQIPSDSDLGSGGDDFTDHSRIRVVREQIAAMAQTRRAQLLDAMLADEDLSKSEMQDDESNPFLPFWTPTPEDRSLTLWALRALNPQLPVERLEDLLNVMPLTHAEEIDLIHNDTLPEAFAQALEDSKAEWTLNRNGGLLHPPSNDLETNSAVPDWLKGRSDADRYQWSRALGAYNQAVLDAKAPDLTDVEVDENSKPLFDYARTKLRERLIADHDLTIEPDDVIIHTVHTQFTGFLMSSARGAGPENAEVVTTFEQRSLTQLSLNNIAFTDFKLRYKAQARHSVSGQPIDALTPSYIYDLVRELDVGQAYSNLVKSSLLTSAHGRLSAARYARVMQAQMRLDALEAKMAGDFLEDGTSPAGQENRGYKWVMSVLDHPVDDEHRARVEGHQIQVQKLRINRIQLEGLLIIGVATTGAVSPVVIYTPDAPDGKCFRELDRLEGLSAMLRDPSFRDYLAGMAPLDKQSEVKKALGAKWRTHTTDSQLCTGNVFEAAYEAQINRMLEVIDKYTNTTEEVDWETVWKILKIAGETVLSFTPFKVAFPIATIRSTFAVAHGLRDAVQGNQKDAASYFVEAGLLLLDLLPYSRTSKAKPPKIKPVEPRHFIDKYTGVINFDVRPAMPQLPSGSKLRTDGFYNGVHEQVVNGQSSFYVVRQHKAYPVQPDHTNKVWRMIDLRHPNASAKTPMFPDANNVWRYHPPGGAGGAVFKLDLSGYNPAVDPYKLFKKRDYHLAEALKEAIEKIRVDAELNYHCHGFHNVEKLKSATQPGVREQYFTYDITSPNLSKGRGKWRLKVKQPADNKGILVFVEIMPWH